MTRPMPDLCAERWRPDILPGFEQLTLRGLAAPKGAIDAVLVRQISTNSITNTSTRAVLYLHGYVDYFFQRHLADFYNAAGLRFYALDLRRHGRALRAHQKPNFTHDIDEFLQDIDAALQHLRTHERVEGLLLNGHSTGGLVAALYAHRGQHRALVNAVFLNSPFLSMNLPAWKRALMPALAGLGKWLPHQKMPTLSHIYGQSLHIQHHGEWDYNTAWKPIDGFPVYAGWLRAIRRAHAEVARGLGITCPVLVLHAQKSAWPRRWSPAVMAADIVLDVADIKRLSPRLGQNVEVMAIEGALHDLTLAAAEARQATFEALGQWLSKLP